MLTRPSTKLIIICYISILFTSLAAQARTETPKQLTLLDNIAKALADNGPGVAFTAKDYDVLMADLFAKEVTSIEPAASDTDQLNGFDGLCFLGENGNLVYLAVNLGLQQLEVSFTDGHQLSLAPGTFAVDLRSFSQTFLLSDFAVNFYLDGNHSGLTAPLENINKTSLPSVNIQVDELSRANLQEQDGAVYGILQISAHESSSYTFHLNQTVFIPQSADQAPQHKALQLTNLSPDDQVTVSAASPNSQVKWEITNTLVQLKVSDRKTQRTEFLADIHYNEEFHVSSSAAHITVHSRPEVNVCVSRDATSLASSMEVLASCNGALYESQGELTLYIDNGRVQEIRYDDEEESGGGSLSWFGVLLMAFLAITRKFMRLDRSTLLATK
ncbi:hypothetical protein TDB9533_03201 [Thalassocella blandensis]|nr:hypothetical protein TDB9533_03201 [Thalassocella blandensis]